MEELYAYSLLITEGYELQNILSYKLDELFLNNPDNKEYFYLEELSDYKNIVLHIIATVNIEQMDTEVFGKALMSALKDIYVNTDIHEFAKHMYNLWKNLPEKFSEIEPFFTFCYADECLCYNDEKQCRELYEKAINYYSV